MGYVKTQLSCILLYYADDMFRPLWATFRSQKFMYRKTVQSMIIVQVHILNFQRDLVVGWIIHIELKVPFWIIHIELKCLLDYTYRVKSNFLDYTYRAKSTFWIIHIELKCLFGLYISS